MKTKIILTTFLISSLPLALFADVTTCKNGKTERRIEVVSTDPNQKVPCEVKYFKEGEEGGKVLWSAQNDAAYCEAKAKEFAEKLTASGWQCSGGEEVQAAAPAAAPPAAAPAPGPQASPAPKK